MKKFPIIIFMAFLGFFLLNVNLHAKQRAIRVKARTVAGTTKEIHLYSGYHALVVGCGDYKKGWPRLPNPVRDAIEVKKALEKLGFKVQIVKDPDGQQLHRALNSLVSGAGRDPKNGIFVFFAGHGHTLTRADGTKLGYIVPVDAPDPVKDLTGFMTKAMSMREIEEISTLIKAKHVLMAFDSCFSGAIFRTSPGIPSQYIREQVAKPVRAFIAAGNENEQVPDESVFKTCLIQGLVDGHADRNRDSYVTGEELGLYLKEEVVNYTEGAQHPYFSKIRNPKLDKGDFIFQLASSAAIVEEPGRASLSVESNVIGARVLIDGQEVGSTPLTDVEVSPGEHKIRVEKQGYEPYRKRIRFEPGRSMSMYVDLNKAVPAKGRLFVETEPEDAKIRIINIGQEFYQGIELESGRYHVEVSADGYNKKSMWVTLAAGEDRNLNIRLKRAVAARKEQVFTNSIGMKFVLIPAGTFMMGSASDEPGRDDDERQHRVTLSKGFYMQITEVTQGQWQSIMSNNPSHFKDCGDDCPVEQVSWNDAQDFIKRLNEKEGANKYRLPTEAEWEYACRAGSTTAFANGGITDLECGYDPNLDAMGWYCGNSGRKTHAVAQKNPNAWGLYDMHGNVCEWCQDWYGHYPTNHLTDPKGPPSGIYRVLRGGLCEYIPGSCRSAERHESFILRYLGKNIGFRVARDF